MAGLDGVLLFYMIERCDERIAEYVEKSKGKEFESSHLLIQLLKENIKNNIQRIKIEKMIYVALTKVGNNAIFPRLMAKYDELYHEYLENLNQLVLNGAQEGYYLSLCAESLERRNIFKEDCEWAASR
jgi:hypothetical protein